MGCTDTVDPSGSSRCVYHGTLRRLKGDFGRAQAANDHKGVQQLMEAVSIHARTHSPMFVRAFTHMKIVYTFTFTYSYLYSKLIYFNGCHRSEGPRRLDVTMRRSSRWYRPTDLRAKQLPMPDSPPSPALQLDTGSGLLEAEPLPSLVWIESASRRGR